MKTKRVICMTTLRTLPLQRVLVNTAFVSLLFCAFSYHVKRIPAHILAPGAHARMPLVDRVAALKIPVAFVCKCLLMCVLTPAE